jgi:hypothetical protein
LCLFTEPLKRLLGHWLSGRFLARSLDRCFSYAWNQLGRRVKKGERGIRILAPVIGVKRKKDEEAEKDIPTQNKAVLVGFRSAYVFERLSRDLWPRFYPLDRDRERVLRAALDSSSYIIAQILRPLQRSSTQKAQPSTFAHKHVAPIGGRKWIRESKN